LRPEEELLGPGRNMEAALAVQYRIAVGAEGLPQRRRQVERRPSLLKHHRLQFVGPGDDTGVGRNFAGEHTQQGALATAVGADDAELRAWRQRQVQVRE